MKRKHIAIIVIVAGLGVVAFPFARTLLNDWQTSQLLTKLETGETLVVDIQQPKEGDIENWSDFDGLDTFEYEDDLMDGAVYFEGEVADAQVEVGLDDGAADPDAVAEIGEMALDEQVEAVALDVEGLKKKRLVAIGKIEIPSIDANLPVVEGAGSTELHYAIGHVVNTADFGRSGNCVLAGHRNYTYGSMLNRLGEVAPGDPIILTMRDGTIVNYEVYECVDVRPGVKEITNFHRNESRLTIVTCTPVGVATHRLLVRAHVVSIVPPTA